MLFTFIMSGCPEPVKQCTAFYKVLALPAKYYHKLYKTYSTHTIVYILLDL